MAESVAVSVDSVSVSFRSAPVLRALSLDVHPGEFLTLLGASGTGKTTLLNVIAGLQKIDEGRLRFNGENVESRPAQRRNVGMVFQSYALFPQMSVGENIAFPLRAARRPRAERRAVAAEMLTLVQLSGMAERVPASLSGGQCQRVALARALAADPKVLLLDEPLAALDKRLREQMQGEIRRIQQRVGITTISVTHDQTEALTMSDRVAILHEGRVLQVAAPEELYRRPTSVYVAQFLGEANLVSTGGGEIVSAEAASAHPEDVAVIRPEDLDLLAEEVPAAAWQYQGVLKLISFQGDRFRLEVETAGGETMICTLPSTRQLSELRPGAQLRLGCRDAARAHIIPADAPSTLI